MTDYISQLEDAQPKVKPGSKEHETLLASGYQMTREEAETIIKEREEKPERYPYEVYKKAQAFLAALKAKPVTISTRQPWRTRQHSRTVR